MPVGIDSLVSLAQTEALRRWGNPYAKLAMFDPDDAAQPMSRLGLTDEERMYVRALENPYAALAIGTGLDQVAGQRPNAAPLVPDADTPALAASMRQFESECRRIFRQYVARPQKGRLRDYQRAFIERNRTRSPSERYRLLEGLRGYDLSGVKDLQAQFNRGRDALSEQKLMRIEQASLEDAAR